MGVISHAEEHMGASGFGLFHDDVAVDVRNDCLDLLANGASDDEAFRTMVQEWNEAITDSDDGPVFWLALAATQWKYGRLNPRTMTQALMIIDQAKGLDRWADAGLAKRRQVVLRRLRKKLVTPPPKKRTPRLRVCPEVSSISLTSPDGKAIATAFQIGATKTFSQVFITMKVKRTDFAGPLPHHQACGAARGGSSLGSNFV